MTRRPAPATGPRARIHIVVFLVFVATILVIGRNAHTTQERQFDVELRQRIDQVADQKAKQVAAWRTERLGDAAVAVAGAQLMPAVPDVMRGIAKPETEAQLRSWLDAIRIQYQDTNTSCSSTPRDGCAWRRVICWRRRSGMPNWRQRPFNPSASSSAMFPAIRPSRDRT